jgi:hypothetical protein
MNTQKHRNKLPEKVKFSLFVTSYLPLFIIIIIKQIDSNKAYLYFGGFNIVAIRSFFEKFGLSSLLLVSISYGCMGTLLFVFNMKKLMANNGFYFRIEKIQNKNTESIGYIATYLLPFMFQTYSTLLEILTVLIIFSVIYIIHIHSTLLILNPILSLKYSLYNIECRDLKSNDIITDGIFIIDCHYLAKGDIITAKNMYTNLYYGFINEENNE